MFNNVLCIMIIFNYTVYTTMTSSTSKWCLYTMMDLRNIINDDDDDIVTVFVPC